MYLRTPKDLIKGDGSYDNRGRWDGAINVDVFLSDGSYDLFCCLFVFFFFFFWFCFFVNFVFFFVLLIKKK